METQMQKFLDSAGIMDREDAKKVILGSWDNLMNKIPSKFSKEFDRISTSFSCRQEYISMFGYVLLTKEVLQDIKHFTKAHGIKKFIELGSGTGFLTKTLVDIGLDGIGYSLEIPKVKKNKKNAWGLEPAPIYDFCLQEGLLKIGDMKEIINNNIPDMIISSWIPYGGGQEVQEFFNNNGYPEYYIVIGEGYGGCTANDEYHDWLENNYEVKDTVESYVSFDGLYDSIKIHKIKEKHARLSSNEINRSRTRG